MRLIAFLFLLMMPLLAEVPKTDLRNGEVPNTDTHFQTRDYTKAQWDQRRLELRQRILVASGLDPMPEKTPLNAQVFGRIEGEGYTVEKVLLETMPGLYLGGNLYRPKNPSGKAPAIVHPHGHWTYGRLENQPLYSAPTFGINLARQGFVVFAYDMVGYNDTPQVPHRFTGLEVQLWQFTPLGLQTWNSIRVVDFLESLPDVDPKRIGVSGASGGGTQTFLLAAIDDRIAASAPVNMVSLIMQGGCICENAPHLRVGTQNVEIAALTAPRPQLIVAATGDWTRNVPKEEFPAVQKLYALYGAADKVEYVQFDSPHNYHQDSRQAVYTFFRKALQGNNDGKKVEERGVTVPDARDLLVLWNHDMPSNAKSFEELFASWKAMSNAQVDSEMDLSVLKERLRRVIEARTPASVEAATEGSLTVLSRGEGDRVPVRVEKKGGDASAAWIVVHREGSQAALAQAPATAKGVVYAPDLYLTGSAKATPVKRHEHHVTFNLSDDANRVQDILTTIAYAKKQGAKTIQLAPVGDAAPWAILAAAVSDIPVSITAAPVSANAQWTYDAWLAENCFIPGLQKVGGIRTALRVINAK